MKKLIIVIVLLVPFVSKCNVSIFSDRLKRNKDCKNIALVSQLSLWTATQAYVRFKIFNNSDPHGLQWKDRDFQSYMQMDMMRHFYGAYWESKFAFDQYYNCGMNREVSLLLGGTYGFLLQSPKEFFDARFVKGSTADLFSNFMGSSIFLAQELLFNKQPMLIKLSYWPSIYSNSKGLNTRDYNAYTFWFSTGIKDITRSVKIPGWFDISFGYSVNGVVGAFENPKVSIANEVEEYERVRQCLISFDVDLSEINTRHLWLNKFFDVVNIIKFPFPALEYNKKDGMVFHPLYF